MENYEKKAILATIIYSDIFDFPLKKEEIWKYLTTESGKKVGWKEFNKNLQELIDLNTHIKKTGDFFCLKGRERIILKRKQREKESKEKILKAQKISRLLSFVPTIKLIGLSGSLSLKNSKEDDDIDLFIIVRKNSLWISRLILAVLLDIFRKRRRKKSRDISNKFCLNMFLDERYLSFEKERHDLYTAHEIVQMNPLFETDNIYEKFITANLWVTKFLPNSLDRRSNKNPSAPLARSGQASLLVLFFSVLEYPAKKLQLWYMKKHITTETINNRVLAFHPFDHRKKILKEFSKKMKNYDLSIFTHGEEIKL